jgi:tRNA threonylcarbamoyl adenosine modification protein (Sua5/YciO/YrdC/YwlC family)
MIESMSTDQPRGEWVNIDDPGLWDRASHVLTDGQCLVLPTDTVYGIAAAADDERGVARLQQIKGRSDDFPPPILVGDPKQAWALIPHVPREAARLGEVFWPGPLTLILTTDRVDLSLSLALGTIGIRVPNHDQLREFLRRSGPLAVSSANKHNHPVSTTIGQAMDQLGDDVGLYIDGGPTPGPAPSTVVDCTGDHLSVTRVGLLSVELIMATAGVSDA